MEKYTQDMTPKLLFHRIWKRSLLIIFFFNFLGTHDLGMEKSVAYGSSRVRLKLRARLRSLHSTLEICKSANKIWLHYIWHDFFFLNIALRSIYFQFTQRILKRSCKTFYKGSILYFISSTHMEVLHLIVCLNGTFIWRKLFSRLFLTPKIWCCHITKQTKKFLHCFWNFSPLFSGSSATSVQPSVDPCKGF